MFRLSDVVQPLSDTQIETLTSKAVKRILHSEKAIAQSGMSHVSTQPMTNFNFLIMIRKHLSLVKHKRSASFTRQSH